jgi:hypothetical protein
MPAQIFVENVSVFQMGQVDSDIFHDGHYHKSSHKSTNQVFHHLGKNVPELCIEVQ